MPSKWCWFRCLVNLPWSLASCQGREYNTLTSILLPSSSLHPFLLYTPHPKSSHPQPASRRAETGTAGPRTTTQLQPEAALLHELFPMLLLLAHLVSCTMTSESSPPLAIGSRLVILWALGSLGSHQALSFKPANIHIVTRDCTFPDPSINWPHIQSSVH